MGARSGLALRALAVAGLLQALHVAATAATAAPCATTVGELRSLAGDAAFPLRWEETSMSDGKPLVVSIADRDDGLFLEFVKAREGLWAEGAATICQAGAQLQARLKARRLRVGPSAHWILRHSIGQGGTFMLSRQPGGQLRIATPGWSGLFVPLRD
ncbi:hypothetical protein RAMLITH_19465 [Ramlibacter sp. RBP-2]|uniref:Uncharacterized protein n=1 Tax=Ramlibacter lithotrophicus TaxID=2606681 RepID=A0A7X6I7Y8_9BURK|nr:hypothetical protein [Ramlibacter lithotrophicus]NKE68006.1 hypothetical protein [Ramlibacter lithotrophicus]